MRAVGAIAGALAILAVPAFANDTQAVEKAGGLRFAHNGVLSMESEDLRLSRDEVSVAYLFHNPSPRAVTITVAFPLPELDMGDLSETPHKFHFDGRDGDVVDFHLEVDGRPVTPKLDVHAINEHGQDITDALRAAGVPLVGAKSDFEIEAAFQKLKPAQVKALIAADAIYADEWKEKTDVHHPNWKVRASYYWTQTFPAGSIVHIAHRYRPVLGAVRYGSVAEAARPGALGELGTWPDEKKGWCLARADLAKAKGRGGIDFSWLEYVLKTGADWAGPIGRFKLTISAPAGGLASSCPIPGLKLTHSPNGLTAEQANFTPTTDIAAAFVSPAAHE